MSHWEAQYQRSKNAATLDDDEADEPMPDIDLEELPGYQTPLQQLTRHWMNERHAPDILPAQDVLLGSILDHLRRQSETIQLLRGDPSTSEEDHMRIMLAQTEVERVKFIVRSYVRTRLFKIEKYARHIIANEEVQTRITAAERDYASRHAHLLDRHFHSSVLQGLPESQTALDDSPKLIMPPMVTEPETTRPVFAHALKNTIARTHRGKVADMSRGSLMLLPFSAVTDQIANGEVELV
ncbi:DNA replication complex GINS protein SLD5 [Mycena indigotica]|uniref:DNA replication complex GINS protein SLD5 n=1 Tax=Mycena indigotica TaxID=2126181 RepID=A0A8H6SM39_9AGAR|nr:DNA replication complex GINS protein SLD5 [Mycena indigotica]KAF7301151.1 DNA replication complex GINS protein SLD5 [Mycena indigotica]